MAAVTPKIAISGAVSTGKTTLGRALAEQLGVTFIEEHLERVFVLPPGADQPLRAARLAETLEAKRALEEAQPGFVVDRCPLDLLNFWFARQLHQSQDTDPFVDRCAEYLKNYDLVVLMPHGVLPVRQKTDSPLSQRNLNKWPHFLGSVRIDGLARYYLPADRIVALPRDVVALQQRVSLIVERFGTNRAG